MPDRFQAKKCAACGKPFPVSDGENLPDGWTFAQTPFHGGLTQAVAICDSCATDLEAAKAKATANQNIIDIEDGYPVIKKRGDIQ